MSTEQHKPAGAADALWPIEAMLDVMRCAHAEAKRETRELPGLAEKKATEARKWIFTMYGLALSAAKDVAPYLHMRLSTYTPADNRSGGKTHEEWVAELEAAVAAHDERIAAQAREPAAPQS